MDKTIFFVGTPIGNLEDITIRALNTLKNSDAIFSESIRSITTLFKHHNIDYPEENIFLYDEKKVKFKDIENLILNFQKVSYVSDSGMPVFMDPGKKLLDYAKNNSFHIKIIPGISSLSVALIYSGINEPFYFAGFPPRENYLRIPFFKELKNYKTIILLETPYRNKKLIEELKKYLKGSWEIYIFLDLTKETEKIIFTSLNEIGKYIPHIEKSPAVFTLINKNK